MVTLELYKRNTVLPELYGKILYDGRTITVEGTSSVFKKFLETGIISEDCTVLSPSDGESYLERLKNYLNEQGLNVLSDQNAFV